MHKGQSWPYDLSARAYMQDFVFPDWVRQQYSVDKAGFAFWNASGPMVPTVSPPYIIERNDSFASSIRELCFAGFVETIMGQDLYVGFVLELLAPGDGTGFSDQCWYGGVPQMDRVASNYVPDALSIWSSSGVAHITAPGAVIGLFPLDFTAVPY